MKVLGLQEHNLQLYGVRRGAATSTFARTGSYDFVAERGRWSSHKVMKSYLNEAMRDQTETKFSATSRAAIEKYAKIDWKKFTVG